MLLGVVVVDTTYWSTLGYPLWSTPPGVPPLGPPLGPPPGPPIWGYPHMVDPLGMARCITMLLFATQFVRGKV